MKAYIHKARKSVLFTDFAANQRLKLYAMLWSTLLYVAGTITKHDAENVLL